MALDLPLSVTIIAQNEEDALPRCLASLPKGCEVIVVDSGSSDRTLDIAKSYGATTYQHPFSHYAAQKNFALSKATRAWVLSIDADEVLSAELRAAVERTCTDSTPKPALYSIRRQLVFMGQKMAYGRTVDYPTRLLTRGCAEFKGEIHEVLAAHAADLKPEVLRTGALFHYSYRDLNDYFQKFNRYTSLMAQERLKRGVRCVAIVPLCLRPPLIFFYRYIVRLGMLDGYAGFVWALFASLYSFVKYAKVKEQLEAQKEA